MPKSGDETEGVKNLIQTMSQNSYVIDPMDAKIKG